MKFLIATLIVLTFLGCHSTPEPHKIYVYSECPTFDSNLSIIITEHNNSTAYISWEDVDSIEHFLAKKKTFNKEVKILNRSVKDELVK